MLCRGVCCRRLMRKGASSAKADQQIHLRWVHAWYIYNRIRQSPARLVVPMSAVPKYIPRYTVDDYATWEGDWELWDGIAVSMSPSPFGVHQLVLFNLAAELRTQLLAQDCDAVVLGEIDWIVSRDTVVRPDVVVLCGDVPEKHIETTPGFVAEVLSESTSERDRTFKRDLYEEQGVPIYAILDPTLKTVQIYRRGDDGKWSPESVVDSFQITLCDTCTVTVRLADLF